MSDGALRRPWGPALGTFFFTLILGPPIGGIVFAICVAIVPAMGALAGWAGLEGDPSSVALVVLFVSLFAVPLSYLVGGLQSAVTGLAFAAYGWWCGAPPFWMAIVAGLLAFAGGIAWGLVGIEAWFAPFLAVHLVPAIACWAVIRLFWPEAAP